MLVLYPDNLHRDRRKEWGPQNFVGSRKLSSLTELLLLRRPTQVEACVGAKSVDIVGRWGSCAPKLSDLHPKIQLNPPHRFPAQF